MEINKLDAWIILGMSDVCHGEGIGPDYTDLKRRIKEEFPDLLDSNGYVVSVAP